MLQEVKKERGVVPPSPDLKGLIQKGVFAWKGFGNNEQVQKYPGWRYHKIHAPKIVNDEKEDEQARLEGFEAPCSIITANKQLINWFWDIEDMSPKQLCVYAKDEYGVDLPVDADQGELMRAVFELSKHAPQNRGRLTLMAHTIAMNYDATLEETRRMIEKEAAETETFEVTI
jgi:hypothetical protein